VTWKKWNFRPSLPANGRFLMGTQPGFRLGYNIQNLTVSGKLQSSKVYTNDKKNVKSSTCSSMPNNSKMAFEFWKSYMDPIIKPYFTVSKK
jgi:hypothetical protein